MISETGMQQQFCLRWNNHKTNLLTVLDEQFRNENFTDVTLACEGGSFVKCHKMVLAACSSYFQCLFAELQCRHPVIVLKDVRYNEIQAILEYMYKGEVSITQEEVEPLLKVAEALKVKGLVGENNNKGHSPPDEYDAISTSTAFLTPLQQQQQHHRQQQHHQRCHSSVNDQSMDTLHNSMFGPDNLSPSEGNGCSGARSKSSSHRTIGNCDGDSNSSTYSESSCNDGNAGSTSVTVKMKSTENLSSSHPTSIRPSLHQRSIPLPYGNSGTMGDSRSNNNLLSLPIWPITGLPIKKSPTPHTVAASMFNSCFEAILAATSNAETMSPPHRKKLSSLHTNRDTPILRTVLGHGQEDPSQPMSLVCHNDGQDQIPQLNGPTTPTDGSHSVEMGEIMHSPSSSPQSYFSDSKGGVSSAIAVCAQSQKPEWKRYKQYTKTDIMSAIDAVRQGMTPQKAAIKYGVPSRTLYDKVKKMGIKTSRPMKRSNGCHTAAFPFGISGAGGSFMFGLIGDEGGAVQGSIFEQQCLLQRTLDIGGKIKQENSSVDGEVAPSTSPLPQLSAALATNSAVNAAAATFSTQGLLQRSLELEQRMKMTTTPATDTLGKREAASSMHLEGSNVVVNDGGSGVIPSSTSPSAAPARSDHRSPTPNHLIKYVQHRSHSQASSPSHPVENDNTAEKNDYKDQVEDLSMSRKPEQQSRVIMSPIKHANADVLMATCSDSR